MEKQKLVHLHDLLVEFKEVTLSSEPLEKVPFGVILDMLERISKDE